MVIDQFWAQSSCPVSV